jgi:hypothetical protein
MKIAALIERMKNFEKKSAMIFDDEEPIGRPTDLVMPRRRWFRREKSDADEPLKFQSQPITRS